MTASADEGKRERRMTVVHVRESDDGALVMFVESSRIYRLARTNPTYDATFAALRAAAGTETPVFVRFDKANSDWIERVASP